MSKNHRAVDRITTIVEYAITSPEGVSLSELAAVLDAPKSSVHSLVQGLLAVGYLAESNGRLRAGPSIYSLTGHLRVPGLVRASTSRLEELAERTGETTMLGTRVSDHILYVAEATSRNDIRFVPRMLERRPLFRTSLGQVFLAELDREEVEALAQALRPNLEGGLAALFETLDEVRSSGVAYNFGRTIPSLHALAAPIRNADGLVIAGITVAGPSERVSAKLDDVRDMLISCTKAISATL